MNDGDSLFIGLRVRRRTVCVLIILIDGWIFRPKRDPGRPAWRSHGCRRWPDMRWWVWRWRCLWRLFRYEAVDFQLMMVVGSAPSSGLIWVLIRHSSRGAASCAPPRQDTPPERVREPIAVEYARSFFPVIVLVLVIRSFLFEPFASPSDSMMPTLLDGDFIFVSKYSYGLRLPVTNYSADSHGHSAARAT